MAISASEGILSILKIYYKDGVENLFFRNSPVLKAIEKERVEGKQVNFAALYGRGGAVGGDYKKAQAAAGSTARNVEYNVTPGQIFSVYTLNAKEVQASLTSKGAYMKVGGNKMFAASEAFRKTLAAALYGSGFGELCSYPQTTAIVANTAFDITLPDDVVLKIDIGSALALKANISANTKKATLTVNAINGNTVNVTSDTAVTSPATTDVLCLDGSMDAAGNPLLPVGLAGWLPYVSKRTGTAWNTYIGTRAFGVDRSIAADRLAGQFIAGASGDKISDIVQKLVKKCRRAGSQADLIIMNDNDFLTFSNEIQSTNTYFTATSTKGKRQANVGFDELSASFSTNYIDNIVDDPACPKGVIYVLDKSTVKFLTYTNVEKINDGVGGNEPGKEEVTAMANEGTETDRMGLIISDYLNVQPGNGSLDGPDVEVTLQCFGSFAVQNPSVNGVAVLNDVTVMKY